MGSVRLRHRPMGEPHPPRAAAHRRRRTPARRLRGVDAGPGPRLGDRHSGTRPTGSAHRAR
jgi:hypothetical protein